jgi:hypothetical protein
MPAAESVDLSRDRQLLGQALRLFDNEFLRARRDEIEPFSRDEAA